MHIYQQWRVLCGVLLLSLAALTLQAQPAELEGMINDYTPVLDIRGCASIIVEDPAAFSAGDRVLLIQMQGAAVRPQDAPDFGSIADYNNAGNYEFATIAAVSGQTIGLSAPMARSYSIGAALQLVRVAAYSNADLVAAVLAQPWDGRSGGVIALEIRDTLRLFADIDAAGMGFRGGAVSRAQNGEVQRGYRYPFPTGDAAQKGEGAAMFLPDAAAGRGAQANGGGGGNDHNAGGGGGSNLMAGGQGGHQFAQHGPIPIGGLPGWPMESEARGQRIFMGGGGGGGHQNNQAGTPGVAGGGIVIIRAGHIEGNQRSVKAFGLDQTQLARDDGAGGGGGGGTVLIEAETVDPTFFVDVSGGDGGSNDFPGCVGPGGGGGGGALWVSKAHLLAILVGDLRGGAAGRHRNRASACFDSSFGARAGSDGVARVPWEVPESGQIAAADIEGGRTICEGEPLVLSAPDGYQRYEWSNGASGRQIEVDEAGSYRVSMWDARGCRLESAPIELTSRPRPIAKIEGDLQLCPGETTTLASDGAFARYEWSTGETTRRIQAQTRGSYWLRVTDFFGCTSIADTVRVRSGGQPATIELVGLAADDVLRLTDVALSSMECRAISLRNTGPDDLLVSAIRLRRNVEFSLPVHQLPLLLKAREERPLTVCFAPDAAEEFSDRLTLETDCWQRKITLRAAGLVPHLTGAADCNVVVQLGLAGSEGLALELLPPYPQPAGDVVEIPLLVAGAPESAAISARLHNFYGMTVGEGRILRLDSSADADHLAGQSLFLGIFELRDLPAGLYLAEIQSGDDRAVTAIVIE